jgi:hypothetical protein
MLTSCDVSTNFHDAIHDEEFDVRFVASSMLQIYIVAHKWLNTGTVESTVLCQNFSLEMSPIICHTFPLRRCVVHHASSFEP